ncbi:MAG: nucleoside phosphorylase [Gammaproteobacteria bacterium]|nr:nucleoside phosphorylase [Gammaproteobacteria bacterium]MCH9744920.1 nucleoside phosphorylase [Gammaproteobacteria bacterium]
MDFLSTDNLMLNKDGSIYHLNLLPEELAGTVIFVGDPERVNLVSKHFDDIELKKEKREFVTHTGHYKGKRISVISTGIGMDNIDIVMNELDALVNIDLQTRQVKTDLKSLDIIRIGTCGGLTESVSVGSTVASSMAISFDTLFPYYQYTRNKNEAAFYAVAKKHFDCLSFIETLHTRQADPTLLDLFSADASVGYTITCTGFYGPQYRHLRIPIIKHDILTLAQTLEHSDQHVLNFEMETAAIYGFGRLMGHRCCSLSCVMANRVTGDVLKHYDRAMNELVAASLDKITQ